MTWIAFLFILCVILYLIGLVGKVFKTWTTSCSGQSKKDPNICDREKWTPTEGMKITEPVHEQININDRGQFYIEAAKINTETPVKNADSVVQPKVYSDVILQQLQQEINVAYFDVIDDICAYLNAPEYEIKAWANRLKSNCDSSRLTMAWANEQVAAMTKGSDLDRDRVYDKFRLIMDLQAMHDANAPVRPSRTLPAQIPPSAPIQVPPPAPVQVPKEESWDILILPKETKEQLKTYCEILTNHQWYASQGIPIPKGLLFYGPPGCGKTETARFLSKKSGFSFISLSSADLKVGFIGQAAVAIQKYFDEARQKSPCIIYIDEIDASCPTRTAGHNSVIDNEVNAQLLQELDGIKTSDDRPVFVFAGTNRKDLIDPAILQRFTEQIEIALPSADERIQLLDLFIGKIPFDVSPPEDIELELEAHGYVVQNFQHAEQPIFVQRLHL